MAVASATALSDRTSVLSQRALTQHVPSRSMGRVRLTNTQRDRIRRAVRKGRIVKPDACQKCDEPQGSKGLWAYVVDAEALFEIQWLCLACFRSVQPPARPTKPMRKHDKRRKTPAYPQMKADYLNGLTYTELAAKWGISSRGAAFNILRDRARKRGEWPLERTTTVQVNAIFDLVMDHLRRTADRSTVYVFQEAAHRYSPKCVVAGRREYWPTARPASYHLARCTVLSRAGIIELDIDRRVFGLSVEEAEDWGYRPCPHCRHGLSLEDFGARFGFDRSWLYQLQAGSIQHVALWRARALLEAIGEPITATLWTPREREARKAAARTVRAGSSTSCAPPSA